MGLIEQRIAVQGEKISVREFSWLFGTRPGKCQLSEIILPWKHAKTSHLKKEMEGNSPPRFFFNIYFGGGGG